MSSIGGYRSPVDLGLGRVSYATDPQLFNEFTEVYNAIHLLNNYLDQLRLIAQGGGGGGSEQTPDISMQFTRFYVGPALVPITNGDIICPSSISGQNGLVLGCLSNSYTGTDQTSNFTGVALTDAEIGDDVRVGVGPAIIPVPGALSGQLLYAFGSRSTTGALAGIGTLYVSDPGTITSGGGTVQGIPVATCPVDGYALFGQYIARPLKNVILP